MSQDKFLTMSKDKFLMMSLQDSRIYQKPTVDQSVKKKKK